MQIKVAQRGLGLMIALVGRLPQVGRCGRVIGAIAVDQEPGDRNHGPRVAARRGAFEPGLGQGRVDRPAYAEAMELAGEVHCLHLLGLGRFADQHRRARLVRLDTVAAPQEDA